MSQQLINRSPDLKRLRDEGYDMEVRSGFLVMKDVPYVDSQKRVRRGMLVSKLDLAGDVTTTPSTHVMDFAGDYPCDSDGGRLDKIRNGSNRKTLLPGLEVDHTFSSKPMCGKYKDFHEKMTTYTEKQVDTTRKPKPLSLSYTRVLHVSCRSLHSRSIHVRC